MAATETAVSKALGSFTTQTGVKIEQGRGHKSKQFTIDHSDFTKSSATGYLTLPGQLPAGATVVSWEALIAEAFVGDTTGTLEVGISGDRDDYNGSTDPSVYQAAGTRIGSMSGSNDTTGQKCFCATATTVYLTITGAADWDNVTAGKLIFTIH